MNNQMLTAIFSVAGARNGYDEVRAEFSPFRDFKLKWTRSYKWISFEVSDYLCDAPEDVMASLASTVFQRICVDERAPYSERVSGWLSDPSFSRANQSVFVRRFRGLSTSTMGRKRDIADSYRRLTGMGLVQEDPDLYMGWAPKDRSRVVGRSSILMKVVAMSDMLDSETVSDLVFDYCLYAQIVHVGMGFNSDNSMRGMEYDRRLSLFPDRIAAEDELRRIGMHL